MRQKELTTLGIKRVMKRVVRDLGSTVREASKTLIAEGVRGIPMCEQSCVLAEYFLSRLDDDSVRIRVDGGGVRVRTTRMSWTLHLPKHLYKLIESFDSYRADRRLYPKRVSWTGDIDGWEYPFEEYTDGADGGYWVFAKCGTFAVRSLVSIGGRLRGYEAYNETSETQGRFTTIEAAVAAFRAGEVRSTLSRNEDLVPCL